MYRSEPRAFAAPPADAASISRGTSAWRCAISRSTKSIHYRGGNSNVHRIV